MDKVDYFFWLLARVAKLVDALDLGSSPLTWMGVRVPPLAPFKGKGSQGFSTVFIAP